MARQIKALVCHLDDRLELAAEAERQLRSVGFAVGCVSYGEMEAQQGGWMHLYPALGGEGAQVLLFTGTSEALTEAVLRRVVLLRLAFTGADVPLLAFALQGAGVQLPPLLSHAGVYACGTAYGAKVMASRVRPLAVQEPAFHIRAHPSPYTGLWLEVAPVKGETQTDFMVGVLDSEISAFGIGPWGGMPERATLSYPIQGIKGESENGSFSACAARDALGEDCACYLKLSAPPAGVLIGPYPGEEAQTEMRVQRFVPV